MTHNKVTSQLKKVAFNYTNSKILANWIIEGLDKQEIFYKCLNENKLNIRSNARRKEITFTLYDRLIQLDLFLVKAFIETDIITSKFILIYAIALKDSLFFDFLWGVFREILLGEKKYISMDDFDRFFLHKKESDLVVSKWSTTTIELLGKAYRKLLVDSTLGTRKVKNIYVNKLSIHPDIYKCIKEIGNYKYLQVILGEK